MLTGILCVAGILLLFGLTIAVHEGGHFLAARLLGMKTDVFSIGMGPALWKRKIGETEYKLGAIPVGGYVALPQMDPNSFLEGTATGAEGRNLERAPAWKKIVVAAAGAAGNLAFAFVLAGVVWWVGKPSSLQEQSNEVGWVASGSAAEAAGLREGERVAAVNGRATETWIQVAEAVALGGGESARLLVRGADGTERELVLPTAESGMGFRALDGVDGRDPCLVAATIAGSGAEAAGMKAGDTVVEYGGTAVCSRAHLSKLVAAREGAETEMAWRRGKEILTARVAAAMDEESGRWLVGIVFNTLSDYDFQTKVHPTPWSQVKGHVQSLWNFLAALVRPRTAGAAAGSVGGPLMIFTMFWLLMKASFVLAVWFTAFLNVNLAVINLLPLPVLDGGHIVFGLWEAASGKPVPAKVVNALVNLFALLFVALFLLLTWRDAVRNWSLWR